MDVRSFDNGLSYTNRCVCKKLSLSYCLTQKYTYIFLLIINEQINDISCGLVVLNTCFYFFILFFYLFCQIGFYGQ